VVSVLFISLQIQNMAVVLDGEFSSFGELESSVRQYEKRNFVELYIRSSRTIEGMKKRAPKRMFNDELKFGELQYACIHGGRNYNSKSKGARPNQQ